MSHHRAWFLPAACLALVASNVAAQDWPTKPIRAIVPVAAGSSTDIVPRLVFEQLSIRLGQTILVENRTGAGGTIGSAFVAKAEPDGYIILAHGSANTIAPSVYAKLGYDPAADLVAVVPVGTTPSVLVVAPGKSYKTAADLVAAGKNLVRERSTFLPSVSARPPTERRTLPCQLGRESRAHPLQGGAEAMSEAMTGRVDFFFGPVALVLPQIRDGKLVPLAVNGVKRSVALADVPTTAEAGFMDAEYPIWFGLFVPARTSREVIEKLNRGTLKALQEPKLRDRLANFGVDPMVMSPSAFEVHVQRKIAMNATLVRAVGLKPE
jgi:tripartite-type tricarboxylate transporter receptor subunit TctC